MPTDDEGDDEGSPPSPNKALARIAATLGCSMEDLKNGGSDPLAVKGASELLSIWAEMDNDADRDRLLEFARTLAKA